MTKDVLLKEATGLLGDVNGDGVVSINDVTDLIDSLLNGSADPAVADIDGSGTVTIDDVVELINYLLANQED